jgi:formyltetrahydrofolate-dependent phosphoribosylglycinamide formyltransferase
MYRVVVHRRTDETVSMPAGDQAIIQPPHPRARLAVLISGSGRTLENLLNVIARGDLHAEIVAVVSSKPGVRGLEIAERAGLPHTTVVRRDFDSDAAFTDAILDFLAPYQPHLIIHAGFLRKVVIPPAWDRRMLNIHPSLIPESGAAGKGFYGDRVHEAVLNSGASISGATVHLLDNEYDEGPILAKTTVPVLPGDSVATLAARVFAAECELYPKAIAAYLRDNPWVFDAAHS